MSQKPTLELDRAARPEDSTARTRDYGMVVKGVAEDVFITMGELLEKSALNEGDRQKDGSYAFKQATVDVCVREAGDTVHLRIRTTRPAHPVTSSIQFEKTANGDLRLTSSFARHANPTLDNQDVNNRAMLDFALSKVEEEVRLVKDPAWWVGRLKDYDSAHGSDYAGQYIREKLNGQDPTVKPTLPAMEL